MALMDQLAIAPPGHRGGPAPGPAAALGDKAYSSAANRAYLRKRGIKAVIPVKEDQKKHRRNRGRARRPPARLRPRHYKDRNTVETSKPQCCHSRGWSASLAGSFLFGVDERC